MATKKEQCRVSKADIVVLAYCILVDCVFVKILSSLHAIASLLHKNVMSDGIDLFLLSKSESLT